VTGKDRVFTPAKGTEERRALEAELRRLGVWDEVAEIDRSALEKAIAAGKWGPEVTGALKAYAKTEKVWTLTVKAGDEDSGRP
jgi:hypothetical protein